MIGSKWDERDEVKQQLLPFANINLATWESRFGTFRFLVPLLHGFVMRKRKPFKIGPQQSSTKVCFDENKQTHAFFTGKLSGHSDLPESVMKWVSQSSARYHSYQKKPIFQQMITIRGTLPKGLSFVSFRLQNI